MLTYVRNEILLVFLIDIKSILLDSFPSKLSSSFHENFLKSYHLPFNNHHKFFTQ